MSKKNKYKRKVSVKKAVDNKPIIDKDVFDENAYKSFVEGSKRLAYARTITDKQANRGKLLRLLLKIALIICTCIWAVFFNIVGGIGMVINEGSEVHKYGIPMLVATGVVIVSTLLALKNKNIPAICVGIAGMAAVLVITGKMCDVVDALALSDENFRMYSDIYSDRHKPTMMVTLFQVLLSIAQYFSYDESVKRAKKHQKKLEKKFAEAPKILEDNE